MVYNWDPLSYSQKGTTMEPLGRFEDFLDFEFEARGVEG